MSQHYSREEIKSKFSQLDLNGDGFLSFEELSDLLRRGRPDITDEELKLLWEGCDHDKDGQVDFEEFVDFIFSFASTGKIDWDSVEAVFNAFCNRRTKKMELVDFDKMCRDTTLYDDKFIPAHASELFKKVCKKEQKGIDFKDFKKLLKLTARRRCTPLYAVVNRISNSEGPILNNVTKAERVRQYDEQVPHRVFR